MTYIENSTSPDDLRRPKISSRSIAWGLSVLACLPVLYCLAMIRWSALTFPYWDQVNFGLHLMSYYDGTFHFQDIFAPQVQTRPTVPWTILLLNAIWTDWNIATEFFYLVASLFAGFGVLVWGLWRLRAPAVATAAAAVILSLLWFSPAANTNHWWATMILETFALLFATASLITVALHPDSWKANIGGAICGWLAAYSLSNGLFVFPAIAATHLLAQPSLRPSKFTLFWIVNTVVILALYVPGLPMNSTPVIPWNVLHFAVVYIGNPLSSLLWYPYGSPFETPIETTPAFLFGLAVLAAAAYAALRGHRRLRQHRPEAFMLFSFMGFAFICSLVTAYGRSEYVSSALAPRYTAFSAFMLYGMVLYAAGIQAPAARYSRWAIATFVAILVAGGITYGRAVATYQIAHDFNKTAVAAYSPDGSPTEWDLKVYPNQEFLNTVRAGLLRLKIGPYRPLE
jgi:hypothetical protein